MVMDCTKILSPWNWTPGGFREFCRMCAIFLVTSESLWIIWNFIRGELDYFIEEFDFGPYELEQDEKFLKPTLINILFLIFGFIIRISSKCYALKLAISCKVADKRCLCLFLLRAIQVIYFVWLRNIVESTSTDWIIRLRREHLLQWSDLIVFLGVIDWLYKHSILQDIYQTELEDMFIYCHQGKKEKLKQFIIRHSESIDSRIINNTKHKGNTLLHFAIGGIHLQTVRYILITFGEALDLTVKNEDGLSPLDLAIKKKFSNIANTILSVQRTDPELSSVILAVKTDQDELARTISQIRCRIRLSSR